MRVTALLLVALATRAAAQQQTDPRIARLDTAARAPIAALLDSARAAGLPPEPLIQRALEGTTKGAPPDRVVAAVRRLADDLGRARDALGASTEALELEAGAAALRAGAAPAVLAQLRRARRQPLMVPLAVLADLVASGVPVDSAAAAVLVLAGSAHDADLVEFRRAVERDIALGASPATAATGAARESILDVNSSARTGSARPRRP
ncbi:MAG TPA: hypothetical protein VGJ83_05490 [Gemmatimonadales bacterium]|jgi:hypothetical protein